MESDRRTFLLVAALAAVLALGTGDLDRAAGPFSDWTDAPLHALSLFWPGAGSPVSVPLWNPYVLCGYPHLADPQTALFYPVWWLLFPFPIEQAPRIFSFLHVLLAAWGAYRYVRRDLEPRCALLAAAVFGAGGVLAPHLYAGHATLVPSVALLPWALLGARDAAAGARGGVALLAAAIGLSLLGGHVQTAAIVAVAVLLRAAAAPGRRLRSLSSAVAGIAWGAAVAGVALVPAAAEVARTGVRSDVAGFDYATTFSWRPARWATLVAPYLDADPTVRQFGDGGAFEWAETTCIAGGVAIALAAAALLRRRREPEVRIGAAVFVVGAALALGRHAPLYPFLLEIVPGLDRFRVPARFLVLCAWGAALLAAQGLSIVRRPALRTVLLAAVAAEVLISSAPLFLDAVPIPRWAPVALTDPHARVALGLTEANASIPLRLRSADGIAQFVPPAYRSFVRGLGGHAVDGITVDRSDTASLRALAVRYVRPFAPEPPAGFAVDADPRFWTFLHAVGRARLVDSNDSHAGAVRWIEDAPDRVALDVEAETPATLVLSDAWHPDWRARLDGRPAPIRRSDGVFRAVDVPAGRHRIEMAFAPRPLALGAASTVAAGTALIAAFAALARRPPPSLQSGSA